MALTGIGAPIGLSFVLSKLAGATLLQAFAAGAALGSTSLGATFSILSTTKLIKTRLGVVITSAAMLDDIVGLVMVQVIQNLGTSSGSFTPVLVIRPVFVSIGFAVGFVLLCKFIVKPLIIWALSKRHTFPKFMQSFPFAFLVHTTVLVGMVAGETYAGTSTLFAAYLAGVLISWFDELPSTATSGSDGQSRGGAQMPPENLKAQELPAEHQDRRPKPQQDQLNMPKDLSSSLNAEQTREESYSQQQPSNFVDHDTPTGVLVYERYYKQSVSRILTPLFFVSSMLAELLLRMVH